MPSVLDGRRSAFLWNWEPTVQDRPAQATAAVRRAGITALHVKCNEGSAWYEQGQSTRWIARRLRQAGVELIGGWGYFYFDEAQAEARRVIQAVRYGALDYFVWDVEDPSLERRRDTHMIAEEMFGTVRDALPNTPMFFCSHAQPQYHVRQPYWQAQQAGFTQMPMIYHTAMDMDPAAAVTVSYDQYAQYQIDESGILPAGGAYSTAERALTVEDVAAWVAATRARGAQGHCWWSLDSLMPLPDIQLAIAAAPVGA